MNTTETLALFEQGKDAWNSLLSQLHNQETVVSFQGHTFEEEVNFSGFVFPADALFNKAIFKKEVTFHNCHFQGHAILTSAKFHEPVHINDPINATKGFYFDKAEFKKSIIIKGNISTPRISFSQVIFNADVDLEQANCHYAQVDFSEAVFHKKISIKDRELKGEYSFKNATFYENVDFQQIAFHNNVDLSQATFHKTATLDKITFHKKVDFTASKFLGDASFYLSTFHEQADFTQATFSKNSNFKGIAVERLADFTLTQFDIVPDFRQAHFRETPDLDRLVINHPFWWCKLKKWGRFKEKPLDRNSLRARYRALRRMASQGHDHLQEQDMLSGEIRAERHRSDLLPWKWKASRAIGWLYQWGSDFGRSIILPLLWFTVSTLQFSRHYLYQALSKTGFYEQKHTTMDFVLDKIGLLGRFHSVPCIDGTKDITADQAAYQLAIKKAFFSLGGDSDKIQDIYQCLGNEANQSFPYSTTVQMLLSALFIFLFLQAIRLRFRVS
ncbi:MAG: pentapeptide repeat-containing protein [Holosporales bacterium]